MASYDKQGNAYTYTRMNTRTVCVHWSATTLKPQTSGIVKNEHYDNAHNVNVVLRSCGYYFDTRPPQHYCRQHIHVL